MPINKADCVALQLLTTLYLNGKMRLLQLYLTLLLLKHQTSQKCPPASGFWIIQNMFCGVTKDDCNVDKKNLLSVIKWTILYLFSSIFFLKECKSKSEGGSRWGIYFFRFTTEHSGGGKSDLEDVGSPVISHKGSLDWSDVFF